MPAALRLVTRHSLLTYASKHWAGWQYQVLARLIRLEAWFRRVGAAWRGDSRQAFCFQELGLLTQEMASGQESEARTRLDRVIRRLNLRVGV